MQDQRKGSSGFQNESISHPEAQGYCIRHFITEHHFRLVQVDCGAALKKKKSPFVNSTLISNTRRKKKSLFAAPSHWHKQLRQAQKDYHLWYITHMADEKPDKNWTSLKLQISALWKILTKERKDMTDWEKNIYKSCTWWRSCMQMDCLKHTNL